MSSNNVCSSDEKTYAAVSCKILFRPYSESDEKKLQILFHCVRPISLSFFFSFGRDYPLLFGEVSARYFCSCKILCEDFLAAERVGAGARGGCCELFPEDELRNLTNAALRNTRLESNRC